MMEPGSLVVVDGVVVEVLQLHLMGDVQLRDISTLKLKWVDFYLCELIDPNKDGESLLTALGAISDMAEPDDEEEVGADAKPE